MIHVWLTSIVLFTASCNIHADEKILEEQLSRIIGELPEVPSRQTVREAAREYVIARQFSVENQHREALSHFRRSAELDPHTPAPWVGIAITLSHIGRANSAIVAWGEVLKRDPLHKDALLILGLDAARMGNKELGKLYLSRHWLTKEVMPVEGILRIAAMQYVFDTETDILVSLEDSVGVVIDAALYDLIGAATSPAWLGIIQQLVDLSAVDIALLLSTKAVMQLDKQELGTLLTVIPLLEAATHGDGSITQRVYENIAGKQGVPLAPQWFKPVPLPEALSMAAQTMSIVSEDPSGPTRLYKASLALHSTDALTLNNLAWITLKHDGPTEEAQYLCAKALEFDQSAPYILDTVGWMNILLGNPEAAIPLFVKALEQSDQPSAETYDHLGDAYWLSGDQQSAVRAWESASMILYSEEHRQGILDGYFGMAHSVWGITVMTPEALYDFEFGAVIRRLKEKLSAVRTGGEPVLAISQILIGVD